MQNQPGTLARAPRASFDAGPGAYRIGLIVLATDEVLERDFRLMQQSDDISVFVTRLSNSNRCTPETMLSTASQLSAAAAVILPHGRLDVVAYGCTSATMMIGYDEIKRQIQGARPGVACATPLSAALKAMQHLKLAKIGLLTPYVGELADRMGRHIATAGIEVTSASNFGIEDDGDMARLTPEAIRQAALEMDLSAADGLFIGCTAIRSLEIAATLERHLNKPVITSNSALFWDCLQQANCPIAIRGFGRLLERADLRH